MTFIHNRRANSRVMINHLGEDEFLVSLNLKAMLQLIKISPLAFTKATKMRQNPNKTEMAVSYWLQSICTHQPLHPSQMVLNTILFLCLEVTKNNLQRKILVCMFGKVFAATVTRKCNQAVPKSKVKCKTEHKLLFAGWNCQESALLQEAPTGIWQSRGNSGSSNSASKTESAEGLRSQQKKQGGST